jgi:hypothetical protein
MYTQILNCLKLKYTLYFSARGFSTRSEGRYRAYVHGRGLVYIQRPKSLTNPTKNTTAKHPYFTVDQLNEIERQFTVDD